jgi:hypothetical protein
MIYRFDKQLAIGEKYEEEQDAFYQKWFNISASTPKENRIGIDRHCGVKLFPLQFTLQYKGDDKATDTGNLFIEVISVDEKSVPGWAIRCAADYLSIYIPRENEFYWIHTPLLKAIVPFWAVKHSIGKTENEEYNTHGLLVPRETVEASGCCHGVFRPSVVSLGKQTTMFSTFQ